MYRNSLTSLTLWSATVVDTKFTNARSSDFKHVLRLVHAKNSCKDLPNWLKKMCTNSCWICRHTIKRVCSYHRPSFIPHFLFFQKSRQSIAPLFQVANRKVCLFELLLLSIGWLVYDITNPVGWEVTGESLSLSIYYRWFVVVVGFGVYWWMAFRLWCPK